MPSIKEVVERFSLQTVMNLPEAVQRRLAGKPIVIDGQRLAVETQLMLRLEKLVREPSVGDLSLVKARRALVRQASYIGGNQAIGAVRDLTVDGAVGPLAARLYVPTERLGSDKVPTLLFFHGGGFFVGDLDSHDAACRHLARISGVQVLSVDYRLAPEHPFPASWDDAMASLSWLEKNHELVNADPDRLAVGGDSAGGNLAAATALAAAEEGIPLAFQRRVYPVVDHVNESHSRGLFAEGFYLSSAFTGASSDATFPVEADKADTRASVLLREEIPGGLAPALVVTAGFDPLRDEGEAYARKLEGAGAQVETKRYPALIHSFFNTVGCGREAVAANHEIAMRLRQALS